MSLSKINKIILFLVLQSTASAGAFIDSWKILKNTEDMVDILDTAQELGETIDEDTPLINQSKTDINTMRHDLRELGYAHDEIEEMMEPYEFGNAINTNSIRKLNRHIQRVKNLNKRILLTSGIKGTPEGITARESIQSNVTLQNIHNELVQDRLLREKKESLAKKQELKDQIKEEKKLNQEMTIANEDSKKTLGFVFSPFKVTKRKDLDF